MKDKIIVLGGKGSAVVVAEQILDASQKGANVEFLGYAFDDDSFGDSIYGLPILGKTKTIYTQFEKYRDVKFIFQLYRPDLMTERINLRNSYGIPISRYAKFIHPQSVISHSAKIGYGVSIMANCVINAGAIIGNHTTIHSNTLIGHDTIVGESNFFAAHNVIGSNNTFGDASFIGLNSTFNNYISIGDNCFVGMASNVIKSILDGQKVYGNPAKPFNKNIKPL